MTSIDHTAYPSIIDRIIAHASTQALFKLRLASTTVRTRVDAVLGRHALLGEASRGLYLPTQYRFNPGPTSWGLTTPPRLVRVLDVGHEILSTPDANEMLSPFTAVTTFRRFGHQHAHNAPTPRLPTLPQTVVDFIPLLEYNPSDPPPLITLTPGARNIVHVRLDHQHARSFSVAPHEGLERVHLVLWPSAVTDDAETGHMYRGIVVILVYVLLGAYPRELVVVGFERIYALAPMPGPGASSPHANLVARLDQIRPSLPKPVDVKFVSVEEWWDELDAGEKDLVGVWQAPTMGVWPTEGEHGVSTLLTGD